MQRKRYRELPHHVDLGTTLQLIPSAAMRKITMKAVLQYSALLIVGLIVYSAYRKMSIAPAKSSLSSDILENSDTADTADELDPEQRRLQHNARVKEHIKQVFDDLKRDYAVDNKQKEQENQMKMKNEFLKDFKRINDVPVDKVADRDQILEDLFNDEAALDGDKVEANEATDVDVGGGGDDSDGADPINTEDDLDIEIEERLAEVLKDAVNEMADGDADVQKEAGNDDVAAAADDNTTLHEKQEFNEAVHHLEEKLNPQQMANLRNLVNRKAGSTDDDHEFPPFVTAAKQSTFDAVLQFVSSVQKTAPGQKVHVYDLDLTDDQKKKLMSICGVKVHMFMKELFPAHISNLENNNWRPLVLQTALAEFGHITWVNPEFRLNTQELAHLVHDSHETGVILVGQMAPYTTFAVTNPGMLDFLPTDKKRLSQDPHVEIKAMMIHNTQLMHEKVMKILTACALEESCISPPGATMNCRFDFTGTKYAGCHRYDESALNILLKNLFNFDSSMFVRTGRSYFHRFEPSMKPTLKYCRNVRDIKL